MPDNKQTTKAESAESAEPAASNAATATEDPKVAGDAEMELREQRLQWAQRLKRKYHPYG
jgi:hypothetical protein